MILVSLSTPNLGTFADHLNRTVSQANRALGILIRSFQTGSKGAKFETRSLLTAYYAHVRSILEYGTVVWAGAAKSHTVRVDRVQHKFLLWLNSHCNIPCQSLSYSALSRHFGVPFLSSRRVQHDLLFLKGLFAGKINSPELLGKFPCMCLPDRRARLRYSLKAAPESQRSNLDWCVVWLGSPMRCWKRPNVTFLDFHSTYTSVTSSNTSATFLRFPDIRRCLLARALNVTSSFTVCIIIFYRAFSIYIYIYPYLT